MREGSVLCLASVPEPNFPASIRARPRWCRAKCVERHALLHDYPQDGPNDAKIIVGKIIARS
jgi:hypothetical protein